MLKVVTFGYYTVIKTKIDKMIYILSISVEYFFKTQKKLLAKNALPN
jgi:hypothetical protein